MSSHQEIHTRGDDASESPSKVNGQRTEYLVDKMYVTNPTKQIMSQRSIGMPSQEVQPDPLPIGLLPFACKLSCQVIFTTT